MVAGRACGGPYIRHQVNRERITEGLQVQIVTTAGAPPITLLPVTHAVSKQHFTGTVSSNASTSTPGHASTTFDVQLQILELRGTREVDLL